MSWTLLAHGHAPTVAAAGGALLAAGLLLGLGRGVGPDAPVGMRRRELRATLALTVDNLRELNDRAERLSADEAEREREALELRAARTLADLRALERPEAMPPATPGPVATLAATPGGSRRGRSKDRTLGYLGSRPRLQGGLWGVTVGAICTFLAVGLQQTARVAGDGRTAAAPVAGASRNDAAGAAAGPPAGPSVDPKELAALQLTLDANPDDLAALVRLGHLAMQAQQLEQAQALTERALTLAPGHLEAQVHRAVLRAGQGDAAGADAGLAAVLKTDPGFAEAWFFRGMLAMQRGEMDRMRASFAQFVQVAPDGPQKERIRAMVARTRTE